MRYSNNLIKLCQSTEDQANEYYDKQQEYWKSIEENRRKRFEIWKEVQNTGEYFLRSIVDYETDERIWTRKVSFFIAAEKVLDEYGDFWTVLNQVKRLSKDPKIKIKGLGRKELMESKHPRTGV